MTEKIKLGVTGVVATVALAGAPVFAHQGEYGNSNPHNKITICHKTGSQSNPYVQNSPNANGNVNGHNNHDGDIIPPFEYNHNGQTKQYPGKNWDSDHQAIYNNGCKAGGQGGGGGTTTTTNNNQTTTNTQVVTTGAGSQATVVRTPQVVAPHGGVSAGGGGGETTSAAAVAGLVGSIGVMIAGAARMAAGKLF